MKPHGPVARSGDFVVLEVQELVGGDIVRQVVRAVGHEHRREHDAVEHDVVLAYEMEHAGLRVFPPPGPVVAHAVYCVGDVSYRSVEPYIKHFPLGSFHRDRDSPVEVAAHGAGLEAEVEP